MPEKGTIKRVRQKKRAGKKASTQAGEFVREEMHHKKTGKHKVKNRKQAIAIGLSKARKYGIAVPKKKGKKKTAKKKATKKKTTTNTPTKKRTTNKATKKKTTRRWR